VLPRLEIAVWYLWKGFLKKGGQYADVIGKGRLSMNTTVIKPAASV